MSAPRDQEDAPVSVNDVLEQFDDNEQPTLLQHEHELSLALMVPFLLAELNAKRNQVQSLQRELLLAERLDAAREIELTTIVRARNELHERYNVSLEQLANLERRQEHFAQTINLYRNHIETLFKQKSDLVKRNIAVERERNAVKQERDALQQHLLIVLDAALASRPIENVTQGETGGESSEHDEAFSANEDA